MPPPTLTPAQIALQAERKAAKLAKKAAAQRANGVDGSASQAANQLEAERRRFLRREWVPVGRAASTQAPSGVNRARIVTWNMLAQTLIRRELFPGSDCLKWSDRKAMTLAELEYYSSADIICLQECDRLDDIHPAFHTHQALRAKGPNKQHGCVVAFRKDRFREKASKVIHLDEEELSPDAASASGRARRGGTRQTKNVGLVAALEAADGSGGLIVSTTHLFWHPKFLYERTRQTIVLIRAIRAFQKEHKCEAYPVVFTGDLNTSPSEAPYQLLANPHRTLHPRLLAELEASRLVHTSVDKIEEVVASRKGGSTNGLSDANGSDPVDVDSANTQGAVPDEPSAPSSTSGTGTSTPAPAAPPASAKPEKDDEDDLPDSHEHSIANTKAPEPDDGILTAEQLIQELQTLLPQGAKSSYLAEEWTGLMAGQETYGSRGGFRDIPLNEAEGAGEPGYTCFSPLFRLTLDYLFLLPPLEGDVELGVNALLRPAKGEELGDGLPRKGITASDHLAVGCEVSW